MLLCDEIEPEAIPSGGMTDAYRTDVDHLGLACDGDGRIIRTSRTT